MNLVELFNKHSLPYDTTFTNHNYMNVGDFLNAIAELTENERGQNELQVTKSEHTEGSIANGAVADVKEIIYTALEEITSIDQSLRLEPETIYNPLKLRKAVNTAFKATCDKHKIAYTEKDLRPEGDEQLKNIWNLIKNR